MVTTFPATFLFQYVKAITLFLQDMAALEVTNAKVYQYFLKGHPVIRETYSQYSGQATDITIERVLLRLVKSIGGFSYGRG